MDNLNIITNDIEKCSYALSDLYNVYDPEIGLNIVDLGLVYELHFDDHDKQIACTMTLTSQFCPMGEAITTDTSNSLTSSFPEWEIRVNLTFDPPWDVSKISPTGREFLGH
ncbi:MAG TPA: metal-sulfur cluster assembly factor [Cyclobacteriaceae bacterium]|nr:metal-sulfur cluster assembly factor [Cyclobacteriaceae bacterium]